MIHNAHAIIEEALGSGTEHGDEVSFNCPFCVTLGKTPDDEEKLWVNFVKELYFCYRCESRGSLKWLMQTLGVEYSTEPTVTDEAWKGVMEYVYDDAPERETEYGEIPLLDYTADLIEKGCRPVAEGSRVWDYLTRERGLSPELIRYYVMLEGRNLYSERVIIPAYAEDNRVEFFVARSILKKPVWYDGSSAPKYLNPKGGGRKYSVFHLRRALEWIATVDSTRPLIVTEGVFSAIAAGPNAVATYGKLVTSTQLSLLYRFARDTEIVVALDSDAHKQVMEVASKLHQMGLNVSMVFLPEGDPDSIGRENFDYHIRERYPYDETTLLRLKLEGVIKCHTPDPWVEEHRLTFSSDLLTSLLKMGS